MPQRDSRDSRTWVVFELSYAGEREAAQGTLLPHLERLFPEKEAFVPYVSHSYNGKNVLFNVMEGYCFVESGLDDRDYTHVCVESPYFVKALGNRKGLQTLPDSMVEDLKVKLSHMMAAEVQVGLQVRVVNGMCSGLQGTVLHVDDGVAQVLVELRTLKTIRHVPCYALVPAEEDE